MSDVSESPVLTMKSIRKAYGRSLAVRDISLELNAGTILALAGPNGSGKTTAARLAAGFLEPDAGSSTIDGIPSREFRRKHGVGFQPEETGRGWGAASAMDVLALLAGDAAPAAVQRVVSDLEIARYLESRVDRLSKGQWRLVLAACSMIRASRLVVFDEPDSGLDPLALERFARAVRTLAQNGSAVLLLSHNLDEVARVADRVCFVRAGIIVGEHARDCTEFTELRSLYARLMAGAT